MVQEVFAVSQLDQILTIIYSRVCMGVSMQLSFDLLIHRMDTGDDDDPMCLTLRSDAGTVSLMPCFLRDPSTCAEMGFDLPLTTNLIKKTMRCTVEFSGGTQRTAGTNGRIRLVTNKDIDITQLVWGATSTLPAPVESHFVEILTDDKDVFPRFTAKFILSPRDYATLNKMALTDAKVRFQVLK
jgi:hypothetical protein